MSVRFTRSQTIRNRIPAPIALLLGVFVALALYYSIIIPLFEGPDEDDHFRYAKSIADHGALPVQSFEPGGGSAGHQGWQPPLAYSLFALVLAPIDKSDYEQHLWRNFAVTFVGDPACCGRNIYYHTDSEKFPYTRTTLAVHLARLLSILFGVVTVAATYQIARTLTALVTWRWGIGDLGLGIALAAASVVAFNPSFLFASALVSNDAPLAAFSSLVLWMWVRLLTGKTAPTLKSGAILGLLIGLGILTKPTALGLIPFSILVLVVVAWRKRGARCAIWSNAVMLASIVLISGWWFVRNQILYGDPLAYRLMITSAIFPRAGDLTLPELFQISLPWLWQTFWGGPTPGDFAPVLVAILGILALLASIGIVLFVIRNSQSAIRDSILVLGAWLAFILIAQIQFIRTTTGADQGRYLFPAVSVIALFFVLGLNQVLESGSRALNLEFRIGHWHIGFLAHWLIGSMFLLALFVPFAYTLPAYARPSLLSSNELARIAHPLEASFADQFQLLGYDLETRAVKPGDTLRVTLYWRALARMNESYRVFAHLIGQGDRSAGGADVIPARGAFPTVYWKPGDTLRDVISIPIVPNTLPGKYEIEVGAYPVGKPGERLLVFPMNDDRTLVGAIKVAPRETAVFNPRLRVDANFADQIELMGYDMSVEPNTLRVVLYWRARRTVTADYTVFVHLLDANNQIVAQADQSPQAGNYPTSLWDVGEQVRDEYGLRVPEGNLSASQILVGLYHPATGERLPVSGDRAAPGGDSIVLQVSQ